MKNNFFIKIVAIVFGIFSATVATSSAYAWGAFGLYDDNDGCKIGTVLEVSYTCSQIETTNGGEAVLLCIEHKSCNPASGA